MICPVWQERETAFGVEAEYYKQESTHEKLEGLPELSASDAETIALENKLKRAQQRRRRREEERETRLALEVKVVALLLRWHYFVLCSVLRLTRHSLPATPRWCQQC